MWRHLREARFRLPRVWSVGFDEIPESLSPLFAAADHQLTALGFERARALYSDSISAEEDPRPQIVYVHRESKAIAEVGPPLPGMGDRPYLICFASVLEGGQVVLTVDGRSFERHVEVLQDDWWEGRR